MLCWSFGTLTGVEWNDLFWIYFDLILKWDREAQTLQHLDQITKSKCLDQESHMHIFPVHCSLSFGIYQFILPLLFWRTTTEWAENRHGDQQRHTDKDRQSTVQAAPTELWPRHQGRPRATISHLDGCRRVNRGGRKQRQRLKERPWGGKKAADSVWEAHYGCHSERLVADNRTSSRSSSSLTQSLNMLPNLHLSHWQEFLKSHLSTSLISSTFILNLRFS